MGREVINFRLCQIPTEVFNMLRLQELWLTGNELGTIPSEIQVLTQLNVLCVSRNSLTDLPREICTLVELQSLYLDYNKLTALPPEFDKLVKLKNLTISFNCLGSFPEILCSLVHLVYLDVQGNEDITSLPLTLKEMRSLGQLNLAGGGVVVPEEVLGKMWWCAVLPSCIVMEEDPEKPRVAKKSATVWKMSEKDIEEYENFIRTKAKSRFEKTAAEKLYIQKEGLMPVKPPKTVEKITLR